MTELLTDVRERWVDGARIGPAHVLHGAPAHAFRALSEDADLVVLGSRPRKLSRHLMLGSLGAQLAQSAHCPVAVIPDDWEPAMHDEPVVMVGVDGSEHSNAAVDWADTWAAKDARLHLIHGWNIPVSVEGFDRWIDSASVESAARRLTQLGVERVVNHDVTSDAVQVTSRHALTELAADADLLVIGAKGHSGLAGLFVGSVTTASLNHLKVPTVVVRYQSD